MTNQTQQPERKKKNDWAYVSWDGETLATIKKDIEKLEKDFGSDAKLDIKGEDIEMSIWYLRDETDVEMSRRIADAARYQKSIELGERDQLAKLKAKYES